jgi:hypothetical protein
MATSDSVSLPLLGVASLVPWAGQCLAASLLVAYDVVMLCCSLVVYLKTSPCPPKRMFHAWHSGHFPAPPMILSVSLGFDALALSPQQGPRREVIWWQQCHPCHGGRRGMPLPTSFGPNWVISCVGSAPTGALHQLHDCNVVDLCQLVV